MFDRFEIEEIIEKAWRCKWKIAAFQLLIAVLAIGVILFWPRTYRSEARLLMNLGRETVGIDPTATTGQMIGISQSSREDHIASALDIIRSRGLIEKVVQEVTPEVVLGQLAAPGETENNFVSQIKAWTGRAIDLVRQIDPISDFERAAIEVEKQLRVDAERKSEVIVLEYRSDSPELSQLVLATVVRLYKEENVRLHRTEGSQDFFQTQQQILAQELSSTNKSLKEVKNRFGVASVAGERESLETRLRENNQAIADTERSIAETTAKLQAVNRDLESQPERIAGAAVDKPNSATDTKSTQLYELELLEMELKAKYKPEHPSLVAVRQQLEDARAEQQKQATKSQEMTNEINPIHRQLSLEQIQSKAALEGYERKLQILTAQRDELLSSIRSLNNFEIEITDLERERDINEKKLISYAESYEQARVDKALEVDKISSVSVAQEASLQQKPISPSKLLVILFSGLTMFTGSVGIVLLAILLDDRLTSAKAIRERLGLPVLAVIPTSRSLSKNHILT